MGIDRPEPDDVPRAEDSGRASDAPSAPAVVAGEARDRETYYQELRAAVAAQYRQEPEYRQEHEYPEYEYPEHEYPEHEKGPCARYQAGPAAADPPDRTREAPEETLNAPDRTREAPDRTREAPEETRDASDRKWEAPDRTREAPDRKWEAPDETPEARDRTWERDKSRFEQAWADHERNWPASEREPVNRLGDEPGSWRGEGNRYLDAAANEKVDQGCDRIREVEGNIVSPAMRRIEEQDPSRELAGFDYRLKGSDRIKEKVSMGIGELGRTPEDALAAVKDPIRYTFRYTDEGYSSGILRDTDRLKGAGFELVEMRNSWTNDEYKGINSRWRETNSGQLFEVQFHTRVSFEAKQLTHSAYERFRDNITRLSMISARGSSQQESCVALRMTRARATKLSRATWSGSAAPPCTPPSGATWTTSSTRSVRTKPGSSSAGSGAR